MTTSTQTHAKVIEHTRRRFARVLVVDDHNGQRNTLMALLQREGFDVSGCSSASEALALVDQEEIAVAVVDLRLSDMSGAQLLEQLQRKNQTIRAIIHTAFASFESAKEAVNLGAFAYVEKSGDPLELLHHVHRAVKGHLSQYAEDLEAAVAERTALLQAREDLLKKAYAQLRDLTRQLEATKEEERKSIARELHDEFGQVLTGLKFDSTWVLRQLQRNRGLAPLHELQERVQGMNGLLDQAIQSVQRMATSLRPAVLDALGLVDALEWQVRDFRRRSGIPCDLHISPEAAHMQIPPNASTTLFRIIQEVLTNVLRHADATHVTIGLRVDANMLALEVQDAGVGFTREEANGATSYGIRGMEERASLLGGTFHIEGIPGKGTTVRVALPIHENGSSARMGYDTH